MGVKSEHQALGGVIGGLDSVFTGTKSAVVALTLSLTPSTGPAFSLKETLDKGAALTLPCEFSPPRSKPCTCRR